MRTIYTPQEGKPFVSEIPDMEKPDRNGLEYTGLDKDAWSRDMKTYNEALSLCRTNIPFPEGFKVPKEWVPGQEVTGMVEFVKQIGNIAGLNPLGLDWVDATEEDEWEKLLPEYRRIIARVKPREEEKNSETLKIAMSLVRCGWQMACDHILLQFEDKKIPDWFGDILLDMMDKEKKRQFDWVKLREEMEKMDIAHLMPKTKEDGN